MPCESPVKISFDEHVALWTWLFNPPASERVLSTTTGYTSFETGSTISYATATTLSTRISTALVLNHRFAVGDVVSIFGGNSQWWPIAMFAVLRSGGIVSGASPAYGVEEMDYALKTAAAKWVFTLPESLEVAAEAARGAGVPKDKVLLLEGEVEGYRSLQDFVMEGERYSEKGQVEEFRIPKGKTNKDFTAFLSFSSGTTGLPKAVMLSHQNVIAQGIQIAAINPNSKNESPVLAALPFFHIMGLIHTLHIPMLTNRNVIMVRYFTFPSVLSAISKHKITDILIVPPLLLRLTRDPIVPTYDLSHIRYFTCGAAPLSPELISHLRRLFPNAGLKQGYGMTETSSCLSATSDIKARDWENANNVGTIAPSTSIKICDPETLEELPFGQPGELLAKGPQIALGYLNNAKATAETFLPGGWIRTGDQAVLKHDSAGDVVITITDRLKELIKVNGVQVAPAELEGLLLRHPRVGDCAVVGVADEITGETPYVFVVTVPEQTVSASELVGYIKTHKKHKTKWVKEKNIEFIETVPKSASGKILRKDLRAILRRREKKNRAKL